MIRSTSARRVIWFLRYNCDWDSIENWGFAEQCPLRG